jgi:hypothetical protein
VSEFEFSCGFVLFYLDNAFTTEGHSVSLDNPDRTGEMGANSSFTATEEAAVEASAIPNVPERTSTPLRRVLDRRGLWNQRDQQRAYEFNLHDRVQRVFTAWGNGEQEYGSLDQMAKDLSEISLMGERADDIQPAQPVSPDDAPGSDLSEISTIAMPADIQPATQPISTDSTVVDASSSLDEETQRHLHSMLEEFTRNCSNERQPALSQLAHMLNDIEHASEAPDPGTLSLSLFLFSPSLSVSSLSVSCSLFSLHTHTHNTQTT